MIPCAGASFLVESGLVGLEVLVLPPGVGAAVVPAGALGDELADLGDEPHAGVDFLGGVELPLQFVRGVELFALIYYNLILYDGIL